MSNPSLPGAAQPWRPKSKSSGGGGGGGGNMGPHSGSGGATAVATPVMGAPRNSFETDGQISHRTHKFAHQPHQFVKHNDPAVLAAAAGAAPSHAGGFNVEDALDAFGNIREHQFVQRAVEWVPVADSGVAYNPFHKAPSSFVKMCADACKLI